MTSAWSGCGIKVSLGVALGHGDCVPPNPGLLTSFLRLATVIENTDPSPSLNPDRRNDPEPNPTICMTAQPHLIRCQEFLPPQIRDDAPKLLGVEWVQLLYAEEACEQRQCRSSSAIQGKRLQYLAQETALLRE